VFGPEVFAPAERRGNSRQTSALSHVKRWVPLAACPPVPSCCSLHTG